MDPKRRPGTSSDATDSREFGESAGAPQESFAASGWLGPSAGSESVHTGDVERWLDGCFDGASPTTTVERAPLRPGDCVGEGGRIEIRRLVAAGGQAWVYEGWHLHLARRVAIKVFDIGEDRTGNLLRLFRKEAAVSAHLRHPNIVTVHDAGLWELEGADDGQARVAPYLILEWLEGQSLAERLGAQGKLDVTTAIQVALGVARALAFAHQRGVVHRDLKPHNIFLVGSTEVKLLDFGLSVADRAFARQGLAALAAGSDATLLESLEYRPRGTGTLPYMAPEQWRGEAEDPRGDVFSAGVVLFEMLTGRRPFAVRRGIDGRLHGDQANPDTAVPLLGAASPHLPPEVVSLVERAISLAPGARFADGSALLAALEHAGRSLSGDEVVPGDPYRYLAPFAESDADWFFGRDRITARLVRMVHDDAFLAVIGPSGAGKSSLIRAGLIPRLRKGGDWEVVSMRTNETPFRSLRAALETLPGWQESSGEIVPEAPGIAGRELRRYARRTGRKIVVFVDQLEALFTSECEASVREAFTRALVSAAYDSQAPVRIVVAIREDLLPRVGTFPEFRDRVARSSIWVGPPDGSEMLEALRAPAARLGFGFEGGLAEEIVASLANAGSAASRALPEVAPFPLLQLTASRLWEKRDLEHRLLRRAELERLGGVGGVISAHADEVLRRLADPEDVELMRRILCQLVTPDATARHQTRKSLVSRFPDPEAAIRVLEHLIHGRLVVTFHTEGTETVELAHESLVGGWKRLRQWIAEERQQWQLLGQMSRAASAWHRDGEPDDALWRGRRLSEARRLLDGSALSLSADEQPFFSASLRAAAKRRRRWASTGLALAIVAASIAISGARLLQDRADRAREAARMASATALVADASTQRDPFVAALLLQEVDGDLHPPGALRLARRLAQNPLPRSVLRGHLGPILSAAFSPDGRQVATAGGDGTVRLWRRDGSGKPIVLRGHRGWVRRVVFGPRGRWLASAGDDGTARLWRLDALGDAPLVLRGHNAAILWIAFSPDSLRVATASRDKTARVWVPSAPARAGIVLPHGGAVIFARFSPDGRFLLTGSGDHTARIWSMDGSRRAVLSGHEGPVVTGAFSSDGRWIATGSSDRTARLWPLDERGRPPVVLRGHDGNITRVAFNPDGRLLATASADATIRLWRTGDAAASPVVLRGHEDHVRSVRWSADGTRLLSASADGTARVWTLDARHRPLVLRGHAREVREAKFSPRQRWILTAGADGTLRIWPSNGPSQPTVLSAKTNDGAATSCGSVVTAALSRQGRHLGIACEDGTVRLVATDGRSPPMLLRGHTARVTSLDFSPDGSLIATGSLDRSARVWSTRDGLPLRVLRGHNRRVASVRFSKDGRRIVTASHDRTARIWNLVGWAEEIVLRGHRGRLYEAAFSPDGLHVATGAEDGAQLWDTGGAHGASLGRHRGYVSAVAISADGTWIATGGGDRTIQLFRSDGRWVRELLGHSGPIRRVAFARTRPLLISTSDDGTARLWRPTNAQAVRVFGGNKHRVASAAFDPSGSAIIVASEDGTARIWPLGKGATPLPRLHAAPVRFAGRVGGRDRLVTVENSGATHLWTGRGRTTLLAPRISNGGSANTLLDAHFSTRGDRVVTTHADGTVRIWRVGAPRPSQVLRGHRLPVHHATFSPDDKRLVTVSEDRTARVWVLGSERPAKVLRGHRGTVWHASFSPDGQWIATGSSDGSVRLWPVDGRGPPRILNGHEAAVNLVRVTPDGKSVVAASWDQTVRLWPLKGAGKSLVLGVSAVINGLEVAPDGLGLAVGGGDGICRLWRLDRPERATELRGHLAAVNSVQFSPDGTRLVSASSDHTARIWRTERAGEPVVLRGHDGPLLHAVFSPDGGAVVTASSDRTARVWRSDGTGEPEILHHPARVQYAHFSPNGKRILTSSRDGKARLWLVGWKALRAHLGEVTRGCLTPRQRARLLREAPPTARRRHADCRRQRM